MTGFTVRLSYPAKELSPNARLHWSTRQRYKKAAIQEALVMTRAAMGRHKLQAPLRVKVRFAPPDRRLRDLDNVIASAKALQDGIARALKVDDNKDNWRVCYDWIRPEKGGAVYVAVSQLTTPTE